MKTNQLLMVLSLIFLFSVKNTTVAIAAMEPMNTEIKVAKKQKRHQRIIQKFRKIVKKAKKKISILIDDGPTMLLGLAAVILGIYGIYYFFSIGYIWGLLAALAVAFFLYLFLTFLNY